MASRRYASLVQLAVFVIGGILGPVWHLAHHQNDHTHGDVRTLASAASDASHPHASVAGFHGAAETPDHSHPVGQHAGHHGQHSIGHAAAQVHAPPAAFHADDSDDTPLVAEGPHEHPAPTESESTPPQSPLDHGRGSVAHLGLVLLGAPTLLSVPLPERGDRIVPVAAVAGLSLFDPPCPLQRPPPSRIA